MSEDSGINLGKRPPSNEGKPGLDLFCYPGMLVSSQGLETLKYSSDLTPLRMGPGSRRLTPIDIGIKPQMASDERNHDREIQSPGLSVISGFFDRFCKRGVI